MLRHLRFGVRHHSAPRPIETWDDERLQRESENLCRPVAPLPAETLGVFLDRLIAARDGIRPEEVTLRYIHEQREKRLYPATRYEIGSSYGGYTIAGLRFLTLNEYKEIEERVEAKLAAL